MKKIVLTGGGTAGHVTPNIALLPRLSQLQYEVSYIGSFNGMERKLIEDYNIPYYGISTGKLRRYFDIKNFTDIFRVLKGFTDAKKILKKLNPDIVFSKGGFVSVPVVRAAASLKIPCIIHESDMTPGLANKLCIPVAQKICCTFPETLQVLPSKKALLTGTPIRDDLSTGNKDAAKIFCNFTSDLPVLLVIGGSLGAAAINETVRSALPLLLKHFQIVHICGKGKLTKALTQIPGYSQFEYVKEELKDIFALSDIVVSRAGSNSICELLALKKPNLLIPLPAHSSRGDQILNAKSFAMQGFSLVLEESSITNALFIEKITELYENRFTYIESMSKNETINSIDKITQLLEEYVNK